MAVTPPKHLKGRARKWFVAMTESYCGFEDEPNSVSILTAAAEQLQRAEQYRAAIDKDGLILQDRFGQPKEHPGAGGERAAMNLHRLLTRELGLTPAEEEDVRLPRVVGRAS